MAGRVALLSCSCPVSRGACMVAAAAADAVIWDRVTVRCSAGLLRRSRLATATTRVSSDGIIGLFRAASVKRGMTSVCSAFITVTTKHAV